MGALSSSYLLDGDTGNNYLGPLRIGKFSMWAERGSAGLLKAAT